MGLRPAPPAVRRHRSGRRHQQHHLRPGGQCRLDHRRERQPAHLRLRQTEPQDGRVQHHRRRHRGCRRPVGRPHLRHPGQGPADRADPLRQRRERRHPGLYRDNRRVHRAVPANGQDADHPVRGGEPGRHLLDHRPVHHRDLAARRHPVRRRRRAAARAGQLLLRPGRRAGGLRRHLHLPRQRRLHPPGSGATDQLRDLRLPVAAHRDLRPGHPIGCSRQPTRCRP